MIKMNGLRKNPWTDREVEQHWDSVAGIYVRENNRVKRTHDQRFRESITQLDLTPGIKVLNISSRDAEADDYLKLAEPTCKVIHAEISAGLMKIAANLRPGISQVKLENYSNLPFKDGQFDRVLSLETLEHVAEPMQFLEELYRTSSPEARLVLSCPPATSEIPYKLYTAFFGGHGEGPHRFLPSREVKSMLSESGWKLMKHKGTLLIPVGPAWLQNAGEKMLDRFQGTYFSELGIRQFFTCEKKK